MVEPGEFWVVTIGKRYARTLTGIVGANLQHTLVEATSARDVLEADRMRARSKHLVRVQYVKIKVLA